MSRTAVVLTKAGVYETRPATVDGKKVIVQLEDGDKRICSSEHEKAALAVCQKLNKDEARVETARGHLSERKEARKAAKLAGRSKGPLTIVQPQADGSQPAEANSGAAPGKPGA